MMKSLFLLVFLLIFPLDVSHGSLVQDTTINKTNMLRAEFFLDTYLQDYYTLVQIQDKCDKNSFILYNKSLLIDIIQSDRDEIAYLFYVTNDSNTKLLFLRTNKSVNEELYNGFISIRGPSVLNNLSLNGIHYPLILQNDQEHNQPDTATVLAYITFTGEYRDILVEQARKKAEKNKDYMIYYQRLNQLNDKMHKRSDDGTYLNNLTLLKLDYSSFNDLITKSGLSKGQADYYKTMPILRKELLGVEYHNNWYYSLLFSILFIFLIFLGYIMKKRKFHDDNLFKLIIEDTVNEFTPLGLIVLYYANKPYDYTTAQFWSPIIIVILSYLTISYLIRSKNEYRADI